MTIASRLMTKKQWNTFKSHKLGMLSLYFLVIQIAAALFAPLISNNKPLWMNFNGKNYFPVFQTLTPSHLEIDSPFAEVDFRKLQTDSPKSKILWPLIAFHPNESDRNLEAVPSSPDWSHWLGTDNRGRDVASRLLYGLRNSLLYTVTVWFLSFFIGIIIGALQGFFGGPIDFFTQRLIEVLSSIPTFFVLVIAVSIIRPELWLLASLSVILGGWISISYYLRAEFLRLRKMEFVEAARAQGLSSFRIVFKHILPNALTPVITFTPFKLTAGITGLAGLDYLGFGLAPPAASWGELLNQASKHFDHAWWLALYPSLALVGTLLILNFIGEALRKALDPRNS